MQIFPPWSCVAALSVMSLLTVSAAAQTVPPVPASVPAPLPSVVDQADITAAYGQLNADYVRGDLKAYFSWFASDYQVTDQDGKMTNLKQAENQTHDQRSHVTSMTSHWTLSPILPASPALSPDPNGSKAVSVTLTLHSEGTGQKKIMFFTAKGSFVDDTQMQDLWIDTPQGWRIERRKILSDRLESHPD